MNGTAVVLPGIFGYSSVVGFISDADPGANFVASAIFGFLIMAPMGFIYILIAGVLPRSGGDYVWISRTIHPVLGFISGWGLWVSIVGSERYFQSGIHTQGKRHAACLGRSGETSHT